MKSLLPTFAQHPTSAVHSRQSRCLVWVLLTLLAAPLCAQQSSLPSDSSGRFLLMVDTSFSMRRRATGLRQAIESLLASDLDGRLRSGDTIGLWTFNEDVYMGRFPLQTWSPSARRTVADNILSHLKLQRYQKKTDLDKVLSRAFPLVHQSPAITLVLLTDGDSPVHGTPFDDAINATFRDQRGEQQRTRMPFVTVLRAEGGRFMNYAVGQPPWPVRIPILPGEQVTLTAKAAQQSSGVKTNAEPTSPKTKVSDSASKPQTAAAVQPLILRGSPTPAPDKSVVTPAQTTPDKAASPPVEAKPKSPTEPAKVEPASEPSSKAVAPVAATSKPEVERPPNVTTSPASNATTEPSSKPSVPSGAGKVLADVEAKPAMIADTKPPIEKPAVTTPAPAPPAPAPAKTAPPVEPKQSEAESVGAAAAVRDVPPAPAKPAETPPVKLSPVEVQAAPPVAVPLPGGEAKLSREPAPSAPKPGDSSVPPVQTTIAATSPPFLGGHRLLVLGLFLLAVAGGLFLVILRRTRTHVPHASLITQSLDRKDKSPPR